MNDNEPMLVTVRNEATNLVATVEFGATAVTIRVGDRQPESLSIDAASALVTAATAVSGKLANDAETTPATPE